MSIPLTRDQVRLVDRIAITEYGISGLVLMENAGRGAAEIIDSLYGHEGCALVVCGTGNNGGDGFVIARHLHNRGWTIRLCVTGVPQRLTPDAGVNARICEKIGLPITVVDSEIAIGRLAESIHENEVVIDAILGTGFAGEVREPVASLIAMLNEAPKRALVAIDIPSGLDCDKGTPCGIAVRADYTTTFVAGKAGFDAKAAADYLGTVHVVDIGCPRVAIDRARREA